MIEFMTQAENIPRKRGEPRLSGEIRSIVKSSFTLTFVLGMSACEVQSQLRKSTHESL